MNDPNAPVTPYLYPNCNCERVWEAAEPAPSFKRFGIWKITEYKKDCSAHGHMFSEYGLAAALRWDLPLGTR